MLNNKSIVLIEDDQVDTMVFKRCLNNLSINNHVLVFKNGEEFINHIKSSKTDSIGIIFLDLNTPMYNGFEFLTFANKETDLFLIPIIVVKTSLDENDIKKSYQYGAKGYIYKSANNTDFEHALKVTFDYWNVHILCN